jgi:hypothetical protein
MAEEKDKPVNLNAYMDETGHSEDPRCHFAGMAGFVAPQDRWDGLAEYWQTVLDYFKLTEPFHMKEYAHSRGQFTSWKGDEPKRRSLMNALIAGILAIKPTPVGTIVSIEDFKGLSPGQQSCFKDPYYIAFQRCTRGAALEGMGFEPEAVSMIYAYNHEFGATEAQEVYSVDQAGFAEQLWHMMKTHTDFGKWMGSYASSTPSQKVQLQTADLFAYELSKEFEMLRLHPDGEMRWPLQQILGLVDYPYGFISFMDRLELLRVIKESEWPCKDNIEEVGNPEIQMTSAREKLLRWLRDRAGLKESKVVTSEPDAHPEK